MCPVADMISAEGADKTKSSLPVALLIAARILDKRKVPPGFTELDWTKLLSLL